MVYNVDSEVEKAEKEEKPAAPKALPPQMLVPIVGAAKDGPSIAGFHKIVDFLRCPQEYKYHHILGITPKDKDDKAALTIGILTHVGRAHWFASQFRAPVEACQEAIKKHVQSSGGKYKIESEREACRLVAAYVEHWRAQPLPLCRAVEYELGPAPLKEGDPFYAYRTARIDDLSNYPDALNKLCIGDLKTTSDSISGTVNEYKQHGQFILYSILWKMAKEGQALFGPIAGIMVDIETKEKVPKFHRELIPITPFQEHWFTASMQGWLKAASTVTRETPVPRNPVACARAVGRGSYMCDYHDLCHYGGSRVLLYKDRDGNPPNKDEVEV